MTRTDPAALNPRLITDQFRRRFADSATDPPTLSFAPGRVNLIGDHIDYCGGTVLPMPIQFGTWVAAAASRAPGVRAHSDRQPPLSLAATAPSAVAPDRAWPSGHWGRFVIGALVVLDEHGATLPAGLDLYAAGNIPASGLSSSASLSVALLLAIGRIAGCRLEGLTLALAAQRIEHDHVSVACGLMDQAAVVLGTPGAALRFDCASRRASQVSLPGDQCSIVVADSGVPRSLAATAYNSRRAELAQVATRLSLDPDTLAVTLSETPALDDPVLVRRARHVATEQCRVSAACAAIEAGDWRRFGTVLQDSHVSLRDDYQVSCAELDALVEIFSRQPGCYGARMTGAGFGGAVVAAVDPHSAKACSRDLARAYARDRGITPTVFVATSPGGARLHD